MKLACCVWAITLPENDMLQQIKDIGFEWIDIQPQMLRSDETRSLADTLGFVVSCVGGSFGMPDDVSLSHANESNRHHAISHVKNAMEHATKLRADTVYVVPDFDDSPEALKRYADSMKRLSDEANKYDLKLGIEHFPGRTLSTAKETLTFIREINHPNLYLLLDSGHLQMSEEDFRETVLDAGDKLGYVHLDDNDGKGDLHWSLCDGVLTTESLGRLFDALDEIDYTGAISLELSPRLPNPVEALIKSRDIILNLLMEQ